MTTVNFDYIADAPYSVTQDVVFVAQRKRHIGYPIRYSLYESSTHGWLIARAFGFSEVYAPVKDEAEGKSLMRQLANHEIDEDVPDMGI